MKYLFDEARSLSHATVQLACERKQLNPRCGVGPAWGSFVGSLGSCGYDCAKEARDFQSDEIELMFAFANQAAQALHRAMLYDESEKARAELTRANEAKDEFLGILAHEMRTPISTIYGSARLLNSDRNFPTMLAKSYWSA
jgi:signal transduction histidine kinase